MNLFAGEESHAINIGNGFHCEQRYNNKECHSFRLMISENVDTSIGQEQINLFN